MSAREERTETHPEEGTVSREGVGDEASSPVLSIGLYIGAVLVAIGIVMIVYGIFGSPDLSKSLGFNWDIWWGVANLVFGACFLAGSYVSAKRAGGRVSLGPG